MRLISPAAEPVVAARRSPARFAWLRALGLAVGLAIAGCGGRSPAAPEPAPLVQRPQVLLISVDGLRGDAAAGAAPNIAALAARGSYTWQAETVLPSVTLTSHASMLSGYTPARHGVVWNDDDPGKGTIGVPTVFTLARAAGLRTAMIAGKSKFAHLNQPGALSTFVIAPGGDRDVAERAAAEVAAGTDLVFAHLPDTDMCGHRWRWMSRDYMATVARADQFVGLLLAAAGPGTTVIVTADHGGSGNTHGTADPAHLRIPWVMAGPGVRQGALGSRVRTFDTAATVARVLGLSPAGMDGTPVAEAFLSVAPRGH
ncbi:MAG TPA: alkaline phosphatase family protein [Vicinamibacteria bacterium]